MATCARCCLHLSMRIMNWIVNLCGVGVIIYSLWLQKMWQLGVSRLSTVTDLPRPWFIYTCLGIGIAVCLSTLCGHMVANYSTNSSLCIYIVSLSSLLLLEVAVLVMIFFKIDWSKLIAEYIDAEHEEFGTFVSFHVQMCRFIVVSVVVLQIVVIAFAIVLWVVGTGPRVANQTSNIPSVRQSFLVWPSTTATVENPESCRRCGNMYGTNRRRSLVAYIKSVIRTRFCGRSLDDD